MRPNSPLHLDRVAQEESAVNPPKPPKGGRAYRQKQSFKEFIRQRDNYTCQLCGHHPSYEVDHIIPFAEGGLSTPENSRILCSLCNRQTRRTRKDTRGFIPNPNSIGQHIKGLRLSLHLSQQGIADELGLLQMHISRVETGMVDGYLVDSIMEFLAKRRAR